MYFRATFSDPVLMSHSEIPRRSPLCRHIPAPKDLNLQPYLTWQCRKSTRKGGTSLLFLPVKQHCPLFTLHFKTVVPLAKLGITYWPGWDGVREYFKLGEVGEEEEDGQGGSFLLSDTLCAKKKILDPLAQRGQGWIVIDHNPYYILLMNGQSAIQVRMDLEWCDENSAEDFRFSPVER